MLPCCSRIFKKKFECIKLNEFQDPQVHKVKPFSESLEKFTTKFLVTLAGKSIKNKLCLIEFYVVKEKRYRLVLERKFLSFEIYRILSEGHWMR